MDQEKILVTFHGLLEFLSKNGQWIRENFIHIYGCQHSPKYQFLRLLHLTICGPKKENEVLRRRHRREKVRTPKGHKCEEMQIGSTDLDNRKPIKECYIYSKTIRNEAAWKLEDQNTAECLLYSK
jgi:hypothetical protein